MKVKSLFITILLSFCTIITFAQKDQSFKSITTTIAKDAVFDKIIDYLQTKEIFIQSVDKQAGFIQAKVFVKQRKVLSGKIGERRTMNFILRPTGNQTKVMLNIYIEQYYIGGAIAAETYYYKDKGILDDPAIYQDILTDLQKAISQ